MIGALLIKLQTDGIIPQNIRFVNTFSKLFSNIIYYVRKTENDAY